MQTEGHQEKAKRHERDLKNRGIQASKERAEDSYQVKKKQI